ncbi:MAG: hypothetical protein QT09_C0012G0071 [archaeon GW2011_AR18]|nr:MAG: hypothetical protein QT09_C0012G0071 [archaeon GW2011_AR18]
MIPRDLEIAVNEGKILDDGTKVIIKISFCDELKRDIYIVSFDIG